MAALPERFASARGQARREAEQAPDTFRAARAIRGMAVALLLLLAETYYVDPAGDDARDGRAPERAWRTAARVSAAPLQPGDRVLFRRGGAWRESLHISQKGAPGRPLEFGAYGEGPKPRFFGSDLLPWPPPALKAKVNALLVGGVFYRNAPGGAPGTWRQDGETLSVSFAGPPREVSVCLRDDAVNLQGAAHVVVRDLATEETAKLHAGYGFRVENSEDVLLERCEAYRAGKHHFGVINTTGFVGRGLLGEIAMPDQGPGGASTFVSYSDRRRKGDTSVWEDCAARRMEDAGSGRVYPAFVTHGEGIGRLEIRGMRSDRAGVSFGNGESGAEIAMTGGELRDAELALYGDRMRVDGVRLAGKEAGVSVSGTGNVLENLVIDGAAPGTRGHQAAITVRGKGTVVRHSTIVLGADAADYNAAVSLVDGAPELTFVGNVVATKGAALRFWKEGFRPEWVVSRRNLYAAPPRFLRPEGALPLADWRKLGLDEGSLEGDPRFAAPGDFRLQPGSPAIDAGLPALAPARDALGRPRGPRPDLGAFEAP